MATQETKLGWAMIATVLISIASWLVSSVAVFGLLLITDTSHDGQAGLSYILEAPIGGALIALIVGIMLGRHFWKRYGKSDA